MGTPSWWSPSHRWRGLERPAAGQHRPGGHELVDDLPIARPRPSTSDAGQDPFVQALPAVAETVVDVSLGPAMKPSSDMDMYRTVDAMTDLLA